MSRLGPKLNLLIGNTKDQPYYNEFRALLRAIDQRFHEDILGILASGIPDSPENGDAYYLTLDGSFSGAFSGKAGKIARWSTDIYASNSDTLAPDWEFYTPRNGWKIYNAADGKTYEIDTEQTTGIKLFLLSDQNTNTDSNVLFDIINATTKIINNGYLQAAPMVLPDMLTDDNYQLDDIPTGSTFTQSFITKLPADMELGILISFPFTCDADFFIKAWRTPSTRHSIKGFCVGIGTEDDSVSWVERTADGTRLVDATFDNGKNKRFISLTNLSGFDLSIVLDIKLIGSGVSY